MTYMTCFGFPPQFVYKVHMIVINFGSIACRYILNKLMDDIDIIKQENMH